MSRFLTLLLVCLLAPALPAEEPAAPPANEDLRAKVKAWIDDLRSDEFPVREEARKQLKLHAAQARDVLEAAKDDDDPEVRRTVRELLARSHPQARPAMAYVRPERFDQMTALSVSLTDRPLGDAFDLLGRHVGGRFEVPEAARAKRISVQADAQPPFAVLERLLALGGLRMRGPFDRSDVARLEAAGDAPTPPRAAAGPVLVEVMEVTSTRPLDRKVPPSYALKLRLQWIPEVQITQYDVPRVEVARDERGNAFQASTPTRRTTHGVARTMRSSFVQLHLVPTSERCGDTLGVLEIGLPIRRLQHDRRRVRLDDVDRIPICLGRDGEPAKAGTDQTVQFDALNESEDGRRQWVADLTATLASSVAQSTVQAMLEDTAGKEQPLYVAGGRSRAADGTVRLTARAYRAVSGAPKAITVSWFHREEEGTLRFRLTKVPLR